MANVFKCLIFLTVLIIPLASAHRPFKQITDAAKLGGKKYGGFHIPGFDVNVAGVNVDVPGVDVNVPGMSVDVPGFSIPGVTVPGVNIPGVEIGIPGVRVGGGGAERPQCVWGPYEGPPEYRVPSCGTPGTYAGSGPGMPGWGWRQNQMEVDQKRKGKMTGKERGD